MNLFYQDESIWIDCYGSFNGSVFLEQGSEGVYLPGGRFAFQQGSDGMEGRVRGEGV